MKKIILTSGFFVLVSMASLFAQDTANVLFSLNKNSFRTIGFYIAPEYRLAQLGEEFTGMAGFSAMMSFNNKFSIGGAFQRSTDRSFSPAVVAPLELNSRLGGIKLEYAVLPSRVVHFTVSTLIGGASLSADSIVADVYADRYRRDGDFDNRREVARNQFFVFEPGLNLEVNLIKNARFFAGASYRLAADGSETSSRLPASSMQGFSAVVGLKIGFFEIPLKKKQVTGSEPVTENSPTQAK